MTKKKSSNVQSMKGKSTEDIRLDEFSREALFLYGSYVVEDRAVPDLRDGLKPSHRAVLWSLAGLTLRPSAGYKKSARAVGEAIGKFHPHGDQSTYGAMVTIANTMPPMVDGQGNWGSPVNGPAAYRYTECRMSKYTHMFLLDTQYLEVATKVPNFSEDEVIPLHLPALLPNLLFNGSSPAPAYGVRAGNPSFTFKSVASVVMDMLNGQEFDAKALSRKLKLQHSFGCTPVEDRKEFRLLMKTGRASVVYEPQYEVDRKKNVIYITSFVPGGFSSSKGVDAKLAKITELPGVKNAFNRQGKKSKGSGPYGCLFVIECQKNLKDAEFDALIKKIVKTISGSVSYRLGVTVRHVEKPNVFKYIDYLQFFHNWIKYRIQLELKLILHLLEKRQAELHVNEVYLFAVQNMAKLLKVLPKVLVAKDPDSMLAKLLKIPVEDAKIILDRKVRQLAKLEEKALLDIIKKLKAEIKQLKTDQKEPGLRAARDLKQRVQSYLKNPDKNRNGLEF